MKKIRLFTLALFVSIVAFSCSFNLNEKTTDFSFSISRAAISRAGEEDAKYKVECILTGDVNKSQTIFLDESQTQAQFNFEKIPVGKNIKVKVRVYEKKTGGVNFELSSGGSTYVKLSQDKNIVNVLLKDPVTITYKKNKNDPNPVYQKIISGEDEYLLQNNFTEDNCIFVGWVIGETDVISYYDKSKINVNENIVLTALFTLAQGQRYVEQKYIDDAWYEKTAEVIVVPQYTTANVQMKDDSSWSSYISNNSFYYGVFTKGCDVKLNPYCIGAYEVTQELYTKVMTLSASPYVFTGDVVGETANLRPAENITWYEAIAFCNEFTKSTVTESDCVYYSDTVLKTVYTKQNAQDKATVYIDTSKKGYRLPTEAEWEFAARGGNPTAPEWKYGFAGVQTANDPINNKTFDPYLDSYGWYAFISMNKTHEVGLMTENTLGLYDMSGNVAEWCYDSSKNNPASRVLRGGSYNDNSFDCCISYPKTDRAENKNGTIGFRVARSL